MSEQNMSEEDYLKKHLEKLENKSTYTPPPTQKDNSRTTDLQYIAHPVDMFPCGMFYPDGTTIQIRPALVKEVQAYSMVNDNDFPDIVDKMNDIIMSCVRVKYSDGKIGSYLDVKDLDRIYILFLIREMTFQQGMYLTINSLCQCKSEIQIELRPSNFIFFKLNPKIEKYFDNYNKCFTFNYHGQEFNLTMTNIGLQKSFTEYITEEISQKRNPNLSFLKIMPYLLGSKNHMTSKEIKDELKNFESMSLDTFQFLNSAVANMKFGIEKLRKLCPTCSQEVYNEMVFPNGASGIFVIQDAFDRFDEE